jgi:hypothetical protein
MKATVYSLGDRVGATLQSDSVRYDLLIGGAVALGGCVARIALEDGSLETVRWISAKTAGGAVRLQGLTPSGRWSLALSRAERAGGLEGVRLELSGKAGKGKRIAGLIPLAADSVPADHVLVHGRSAGGCKAIPLPAEEAEPFTSYLLLTLTRDGTSLNLSQPLAQRNPSRLTGRPRGRAVRDLEARTPLDARMAGGAALKAEPLFLFSENDGHSLLEAWAREQRPRALAPVPPAPGWNSWDYYRWTVTEEAVVRNAEFIAADPVLSRHVKRIIVDDGWQYCYGEWDANPLFPHGMKWLAKRIAKLGMEPGLWIAPGAIEPHARMAQWDMDMLAKGRSGLPCLAFACMERFGFVLDPTVPKSQRWLGDLFTRYADMGYRYFKLDFLQQILKAPVFADPSVPRGDLVRMLVEPARKALRGRARIMGCGYDFFAGTACVDEVRTSSDIHARWDCIKENVGSIASRGWAQGRFWGNDPDFALCRGPETSDDPDLARLRACLVFIKPEMPVARMEPYLLSTMSLDEARTLLSLVLISGGAVNLSDDMTRLNAAGLDLARRTVAAERGAAGVAVDLFTSRYPALWTQSLARGRRVLLVNWTDKAQELACEPGPGAEGLVWRNVWTDEPVALRRNRLVARLAPHACLLAEGREAGVAP